MAKQVTRCQKILHRPGTILILLHLLNNEHVSLSLNPIFSFAVATFTAGQLAAQSSSPTTLVKADRSLDPHPGNVVSPATALIGKGKIKEVSQ